MASGSPNILILMTDQHSKHHLGCYGDEVVRTPNLDALAARGVTLDNAYCASPHCVPSRMSFMTGRRPTANEVWNNLHVLRSDIPTWAHALGAAGYETSLIGRMHFVGPDQRHGFERRPLGEYNATHFGARRRGGPTLDKLRGTAGQDRRAVEVAGRGRTTYQAFDDRVVRATCEFLMEKADEPGERPFAAVAGFLLPHCPFAAPNDLFDYYYRRVDVPQPDARERAAEPPAITKFKQLRGLYPPLDEERIRVARAAYFGLCEYVDRKVGEILAALDASGLRDSTLVIYCSDHGEMAGEHGSWWKSNYYEGSVGVPFIASLPGTLPEGLRSGAICNLMDVGPTLLDLAGADPMPAVDGRSMLASLRQPEQRAVGETLSEHFGKETIPSRMIRRGPWKLYKYHDSTPPALFNLDDDPGELFDLGRDAAVADIREELLSRLYDGWDPEYVLQRTAELDRDLRLVEAWGRSVDPEHSDALPVPEDAEDVELL